MCRGRENRRHVARHGRNDAGARVEHEVLDGVNRRASLARSAAHGPRERVQHMLFGTGGKREELGVVNAPNRSHADDDRRTRRHRARLVDEQDIHSR